LVVFGRGFVDGRAGSSAFLPRRSSSRCAAARALYGAPCRW